MDRSKIEKSFEYVGYERLSILFYNLYRTLNSPIKKIKSLADRMRFEQYKMLFGERDDDIYISTFPKSGTTMMQMILYQLTTDGEISFKHIYDVSPWIRNHSLHGIKPPELSSPRLIKTHDYYKDFHKDTKGKFIYIIRNGMDVAVSLYHQNKNYNNPNLKFDKYVKSFMRKSKRTWFYHTKQWLRNKHGFPILYLRYEDLLENKEREIRKVIDFLKLEVSEETFQRAIEKSSFENMKKLEDKFGVKPPEDKKVYDQFIRKGEAGEGKAMFNEIEEKTFKKKYSKIVQKLEEQVFKK